MVDEKRCAPLPQKAQNLDSWPSVDHVGDAAHQRNKVVNLAIMLEPIYWPRITGILNRPGSYSEARHQAVLDGYQGKVLGLVKAVDVTVWERVHTSLRIDAAKMDRNDELYLLLRLANWRQREKLQGRVSGALWLRHIAEVIRRAFEEIHGVQWLEEDQAFGNWYRNGRTFAFGSERPLDDEEKSSPYLAWNFELLTGSVVRWYVEGKTEYHAIRQVIPEPAKAGIELVDLRGVLKDDKDDIALKLGEWLKEDKAHRRFSIISFDLDVAANAKTVRRQVEQNNVVGCIGAHNPDFEFANFDVQELAEIAAQIDEAHNCSGDAVRQADWSGIARGKAFQEKYISVSARKPRSLKGEEWGKALAKYADEHPTHNDRSERPFLQELRAALMARVANYDFHAERMSFEPVSFKLIDLKAPTSISV